MSLRNKTITGIIWTSLGTFGSGLVGFLVTIVLARFLSPNDFGTIEIIMSVVVLSEVLVDCGFSQALIREKEVSQRDLSTIFFLNLATAAILYGIIFLCTPLISSFYGIKNDFDIIVRILSFKIIIDSLAICQIANCMRTMQFQTLAKISFLSTIIAGTLSLVSIFCGAGIWGLVIFNLGFSFAKTVSILFLLRWSPTLEFEFSRIKYYLNFGGALMVTRIVDKAISTVETLSVGKAYTKTDLGLYAQAQKFNSLIVETLLGIVQKVTYPSLAKVDSEERLLIGYKDIIRICMYALSPISMFLVFNSREFMTIFFGDQWVDSAFFLRLFAITGLFAPLNTICFNIFLVKGKTKQLLKILSYAQIVRLFMIILLVQFDLKIFALGVMTIFILKALLLISTSGKMIKYPLTEIFLDNGKTIISSFLGVALSSLITSLWGMSLHISFVISFILSIGLYITLNRIFHNPSDGIAKSMFLFLIEKISSIRHKSSHDQ